MTTRKQPDAKKRRQPARTPVAADAPALVVEASRATVAPSAPAEPTTSAPVETHDSAIQKPGLIPRGMA